ncbi:hypothetical protein FBUS_03676 [Fasciolopsis buskii]|uniref:Leucine-rich repeat protein soc-2 homolog n=1 Tax=Fasciolopsis buskii TaxID=27845 RepID=A0A8E0RPH3_9TREM|nr:hypothetical protein FBUS_03676 [Fasciolopsis buski]
MSGLNDEAISNEHHKKTNLIVDTKKLNESKTDFWILDYSKSGLRDLPKFSQEKMLSYELIASGNKISYINPDIQKLRLLTSVDLSRNRLATFPSVLCKLRYLKALMLSGNMLSAIPQEVENLKALEQLACSFLLIEAICIHRKFKKINSKSFRSQYAAFVPYEFFLLRRTRLHYFHCVSKCTI